MEETNLTKPPHRPRRRQSLVGLLLILASGLIYGLNHPTSVKQLAATGQPGLYQVTHVVDGDTIEVKSGNKTETVRYIGIDTPETHDPRKPVQCFGQVAADRNQQMVRGKAVRLVADPADSDRDKYHRLLRYIYLPDGTFVNQQLVQQGYAFAYTVFPNSKLDQFRAWEQEAQQNNRGLWASCNVDESSDIKQTAGPKA